MSETRSVEASGADIEEAIADGLKQLDVSRENVIVEVLEEPSRGLLGIGARMARVRLTTAVPPRSARNDFVPSTSSPAPSANEGNGASDDDEDYDDYDDYDDDYDEDDDLDADYGSRLSVEADAEVDQSVQQGRAILEEILRLMHISAHVDTERSAPGKEGGRSPWVLHIQGDDLGVLIGHRGKTLSALQYIARLIASRDLQERVDFIVDIEGYKMRRQEALERMAHRLAADAVRRRRTVKMEPMPPHERRIIHMALRDNPKVETQSEGEGDRRRVTIVPKRR